MASNDSASDYNLNLTFRSVFTKNDEYQAPLLPLPVPAANQLYQLLSNKYNTTGQMALDAVKAIITLSPGDIPTPLLDQIADALTDGYGKGDPDKPGVPATPSAAARTQDAMGVWLGVPVSKLLGRFDLPGSYTAVACKDERGAIKICGFNVSYRVITEDNVVDLSLVYAEPYKQGGQ